MFIFWIEILVYWIVRLNQLSEKICSMRRSDNALPIMTASWLNSDWAAACEHAGCWLLVAGSVL